jgi:uncharacterized protein YbjQ (UPF0145 family)
MGVMIVVTTETIAGQRIVTTIGLVFGLAVRSRGITGNIMAGLASLAGFNGDAMTEFLAALAATRDEAIAQMAAMAAARGANAVVQLRFDTAEVGHDMSEVVAYGTAVISVPAQ